MKRFRDARQRCAGWCLAIGGGDPASTLSFGIVGLLAVAVSVAWGRVKA
jgi:hypothetical protein